jgi:CHAD domain-containing protein
MSAKEDIGLFLKQSINEQISTLISLTKNRNLTSEILVHETRKGIKRIRSIFRLLKPVIAERSFYKINELLAETGRLLTVQRESFVNYQTYKEIENRLGDLLTVESRIFLNNTLEKQFKDVYSIQHNYFNNLIAKVTFQLSRIRDTIDKLVIRKYPPTLIELAINRDYMKTINYYNVSKLSLNIEVIHKWRRFCKHISTQLKFGPVSSSELNKQLTYDIDNISEILGKEHDYTVLNQYFIKNCYRQIEPKDSNLLAQYIDKERNKLRKNAFIIGRDLFKKELYFNQPVEVPV